MNGNKPNLTLSMDDKIYLAVAKNSNEKFVFIYTLACLKSNKQQNSYNMHATREVHTFKNPAAAELYHDTIEQIVEINAEDKNKQAIFKVNEQLIDSFMENIR